MLRKICAASRDAFGHDVYLAMNCSTSPTPASRALRRRGISSALPAMAFRPVSLLLLSCPLWFAACRDTKVAVYQIPKEVETTAPATPPPSAMPGAGTMVAGAMAKASGAELEWTAPASWKAKPLSSMRKGSYTVGADGPAAADFAITAFPGNVGGDLANVNRWRGQLNLPPIAEADLAKALMPLEANGLKMGVAEIVGGTAEQPMRMLGAIVPFEGSTWFFKLSGPDATVAGEKAAYLEFLRTVKAGAASARSAAVENAPASALPAMPEMAGIAVPKAEGPELKWTAPAHWASKPATAMRKATYSVSGDAGTTAELAVSAFPGSVGGELANVNRWRGQLQLPPITEADLAGAVSRTTVHGLSVTLVDLTGGPADQPVRLLGAIVPLNGANWFFKFTGPAPLVAREQANFLAVVQTLQAP